MTKTEALRQCLTNYGMNEIDAMLLIICEELPAAEQNIRLALELALTIQRWMPHPSCKVALLMAKDAFNAKSMPKGWRMLRMRTYRVAIRWTKDSGKMGDYAKYISLDAAEISGAALGMVDNFMSGNPEDAIWSATLTIERVGRIKRWLEKGGLPGVPRMENQIWRVVKKWEKEKSLGEAAPTTRSAQTPARTGEPAK